MAVAAPEVNSTLASEPWLCTYSTCSVSEFGQLHYVPSLAGNVFYLAVFALGLLVQICLGVRYRTWGYLVAMFGGIGLEIIGYTARVELHIDDFNNNFFIIYLVGTYSVWGFPELRCSHSPSRQFAISPSTVNTVIEPDRQH